VQDAVEQPVARRLPDHRGGDDRGVSCRAPQPTGWRQVGGRYGPQAFTLAARKTTPPIATRWKAAGRDLRVGDIREARIVATFISFAAFNRAMAFEPSEDATGATAHAFYALLKEQLFTEWSAGDVEHLRTKYNNVTEAGIVFLPSVPGIELFLWAHGKGHKPISAFFDPDEDFEFDVPLGYRSRRIWKSTSPTVSIKHQRSNRALSARCIDRVWRAACSGLPPRQGSSRLNGVPETGLPSL
jgi:hypothetical protein